jgi:hypothetical protein
MFLAPTDRVTFNFPSPARGLSGRGWAIRIRHLVFFAATLATTVCAYGDQSAGQKEPAAPTVDFQAVVERDSVKRSEDVTVFCLITNKSNIELKNLKVTLLNAGALIPRAAADPHAPLAMSPPLVDLPAFGAQRSQSTLTVGTGAEFAQHRLIFALDYTWEAGGKQVSSAQTTTLTLPVVRQFEEEAKGLPGGTAPILYMLMPIIPAILAYELFNSLRTGEGVKMPQFKTEYIVPSFLLAVLLGFVALFAARRNASVDYSSPSSFVLVIVMSAALGAAIVGIQWVCDRMRWWRRGFKATDSAETYLSKALLQLKDGKAPWVTGTVEGQQWEGALLTQPDKSRALGARMQISVKPNSVPSWKELTKAIDQEGKILDRASLRRWLRKKALTITYLDKIKQAGKNVDPPVVEKFTADPNAKQTMMPIVRPFS